MKHYIRRAAPLIMLTAVALIVSACGGSSSTGTVGRTPTLSIAITINPIASGTSAQASATITDASGNTSPASGVTWSSGNPSVANVSAAGLVTGAVVGTATIFAQSAGVTGQTLVTVTPGTPVSVSIYSGDGQSGGDRGDADPGRRTVPGARGDPRRDPHDRAHAGGDGAQRGEDVVGETCGGSGQVATLHVAHRVAIEGERCHHGRRILRIDAGGGGKRIFLRSSARNHPGPALFETPIV